MALTQEMIEQVAARCFSSPELAPERKKAWRHFFGEDDPRPVKYWTNADERVSRERRFLGWFMLDYALPTGEKPAEFAAKRLYAGSTRDEALKAFSRARYLFAVVTGVGRRSVYLDLEGETFEVRYPAWVSHLSPNQGVVAHLVPAGHGYWLPAPGWLVWPVSIGPGMRANLKAYQSDPVSTERSLQGRFEGEEKPKLEIPRDDSLEPAVARMAAWARRKRYLGLSMSLDEWRALVQRHISARDMNGFVDEVLRKASEGGTRGEPDIGEFNEMLGLATNIWNNTPQPDRGGMSPNQLIRLRAEAMKKTSGRMGSSKKATSRTATRPKKTWVFDPDRGGRPIPDTVKQRTEQRIRRYAEEHFAGRYTRLDIRFRGQFCYVDAYTEPDDSSNWPPPDWLGSREEYMERLRNTPTHLCRLRYFGDDRWGFAFYTYSNERYELSVFPSGEFFGLPEEAFRISAEAYLR